MSLHHYGVVFAIDACLEISIDGLDEIIAVALSVESNDAASQQSFQQFVAPRAYSHSLRAWPGDVPERDHRCRGKPLANHRGRQSKVVVLHENDGVFRV